MPEEYTDMKSAISRAFDMFLEQVSLLRANTEIYGQRLIIDTEQDERGVVKSAKIEGYALFENPATEDEDEDDVDEVDYSPVLKMEIVKKEIKTGNSKDGQRNEKFSKLETPWVLQKSIK